MKFNFIALGAVLTALMALAGCAGTPSSLSNTLGNAKANQTLAQQNNVDATATASATAKIDSAQVLMDNGKVEESQAMAEQGDLELRLALATAERDQVKAEDEKLEKELRADVERKLLYQSILDKETNKEGAAK